MKSGAIARRFRGGGKQIEVANNFDSTRVGRLLRRAR
jgi:hypothetical protein